MAYPESLLVPGERVVVHLRPHWRMLVVPVLVPPVAVGVGAWVAGMLSTVTWHATAWIVIAVLVAGLVVWSSLAPVARWRSTHFVVTDRRLLVREGVLGRVGIVVMASTITAVRTRQTATERLLGCGTLVVGVANARDPWEFDGIGDLVRTAALVEQVAEDRGGLRVPDDVDDLTDDDPDDVDDDLDDDLDADDVDGWGAWDDEPAPRSGRGARRSADRDPGTRLPARRRSAAVSPRRVRAARTSR
jgi:membrane protein YdbS with pleckstrin-like domain